MATRDDKGRNEQASDHDDADRDVFPAHVEDAFLSVPLANDATRDAHIDNALRTFDAATSRSSSRMLSMAAAVFLVFGIGAVSGWVVRNNNTPAVAQQSVRTPTTTIPCHELFPSINFVGYATPALGDTAVFLDSRSVPEAIVLVDPMTCLVVSRFELATPIAVASTTVP